MRLKSNELTAIVKTISNHDSNAQIYLFGSRVDDHKKGGDIDVLVISDSLTFTHKLDILIDIKGQIGEQKIDLILANSDTARQDPFITSILNQPNEPLHKSRTA